MNKTEKLIWQAKMLIKTNWINAKILLEEGKQDFPEEREIYIMLGDLYAQHDLHKEAIKNYQKALELEPNDDYLRFKFGNSLLVLDEYRLALDQYNLCEEKFPELTYNKAYAYYKMGKISISIQLMEEIVNDPLATEMPLIFMTELHFMKQEYEKAISYIDKAEKRFGVQGNFLYLKGLAYFHLENYLKAFINFQKAEKLAFSANHFCLNYGIVAHKIGKDNKAEKMLLKFIEDNPENGQGYAELINFYIDMSEIKKAEKIAKKAKKNSDFSLTLSLAYNKLHLYTNNQF